MAANQAGFIGKEEVVAPVGASGDADQSCAGVLSLLSQFSDSSVGLTISTCIL